MTTDPELVPVAQGDVDHAFLALTRDDSTPEEIEARMLLMRYIADHARIVAELEAESHRRLRIAEDTAAIASEFQRRYKEVTAELAALRARVEESNG